ncbi:hypothetical protein [Micromonospora sp. NPDC005299]
MTKPIPAPVADYEAATRLTWEYLRGEAERRVAAVLLAATPLLALLLP